MRREGGCDASLDKGKWGGGLEMIFGNDRRLWEDPVGGGLAVLLL